MHLVTGAIVTHCASRYIIATHYIETHREPINHKYSNSELHARAAAKLVRKLGAQWTKKFEPGNKNVHPINSPYCGKWVAGDMPKGAGFAFCYYGATDRQSGIEPGGFVQNCETEF